MKRKSIIFFLMLIAVNCFAQKVETVKRIPFGTDGSFNYWTEWDYEEGRRPDLKILAGYENSLILCHDKSYFEYNLKTDELKRKFTNDNEGILDGIPIYGNLPGGFIYGNVQCGWNVYDDEFMIQVDGKEYFIDHVSTLFNYGISEGCNFHYTDNTVFFKDGEEKLVSIQLFENGEYKIRNQKETAAYLTKEKIEELGVDFILDTNNEVTDICIGDYSLHPETDGINYWKIQYDTFKMMPENYSNKKNIDAFTEEPGFTVYKLYGYDSKGLHYFLKFDCENGRYSIFNPGFDVRFSIAVLDPWEKQVYIYDDYAENEWNPPKKESGKPIAFTTWLVAPDGNLYFTDCDADNKEWLIKRVPNRWYSDLGINSRHIGRFTTNHIPLYKTPSESAENDGFNFENDIVWEKETEGEWSRIQKLDGRVGWVQTKYIAFDDKKSTVLANKTASEKSSYNVAVNKILKTNDNLRLRKEEATSSEVITTMLKGTKVKVLKLGKEETIDGIKSCWVQVEVQKGGKDKNGKPIAAGTKGWCYGGYLE